MTAAASSHDEALSRHEHVLGGALGGAVTPALVIDVAHLEANVARMAEAFTTMPAALRPHVKVHKCPQIAQRQIAAGAIGVATATVREAVVMAQSGIDDVLVANQVVGAARIAALLQAPADTRLTVAVDDPANVAALGEAACAAERELEVLVELDIGQRRCGVRDGAAALRLAEQVAATRGLRLRGLQGYEGHCMLEPDHDVRRRLAETAIAELITAADGLQAAGLPCDDLSGGGTGTWFITGANPRVTEIQAGSYALMDAFHGDLVPGGFDVAMTVLATVISRQGATVVLDAGRKAVGIDFCAPRVVGHADATVRFVAEEHLLLDFPGPAPLKVGDLVQLVAGYGPTTVNLHDAFLVVRDGLVEDVWPIAARGFVPC
jgi:D-serine deaminase-like pyridoxal phosphate-dependent protein